MKKIKKLRSKSKNKTLAKKKVSSGKKKETAVIYCNANYAGQACEQCLDKQEKCCREYCARENLEVLRVFREISESTRPSSQFDEMQKFIEEHGEEISFIVDHSIDGKIVLKNDVKKASKKTH